VRARELKLYEQGSPSAVEQDYCPVGMVFGFFAGQYSHTNELGVASTISSRLVLRRLKLIRREQVGHLGHGLYMAGPCAYCRPTQRTVLHNRDDRDRYFPSHIGRSIPWGRPCPCCATNRAQQEVGKNDFQVRYGTERRVQAGRR
jgi:hypothetical protein